MVNAEKAGVMFTVHPSTGDEKILIEAAWGLGEAVVSGTVTPDTIWVNKETEEIIDYQISEKSIMYSKNPNTGKTEKNSSSRKFEK